MYVMHMMHANTMEEMMTSKNKYDLQKWCRFVVIINKSVPSKLAELTCYQTVQRYNVNIANSKLCISIPCWFMRIYIIILQSVHLLYKYAIRIHFCFIRNRRINFSYYTNTLFSLRINFSALRINFPGTL